jgi:protein tyrosine/serine phosphatase
MASLAKQAKRAVRRVTRGMRDAVIEHAPDWAKRTFGPPATYLDMLFVDHGIFRLLYLNKHRLSDAAWRAAQPAPHNIRAFARQGVKTIVNLRGPRVCGSYWLEKRACAKTGIKLVDFTVYSRGAPTPRDVHAAAELFRTVEYPILMHCKSGADRAGLMGTLFKHLHEGQPIEIARNQLSLRYGHIRQADTGILDYFFDSYLAENARQPISFVEWVDTKYDPVELKRSFQARGWANRLVNSVLRRE